jgi:hypothetical protein
VLRYHWSPSGNNGGAYNIDDARSDSSCDLQLVVFFHHLFCDAGSPYLHYYGSGYDP